MPNNRLSPATATGLTPLLFCNEITVAADAAPLACPQCTGANLHLDTVHFATPTNDPYRPAVGLSINPDTGAVLADEKARALHAGQNRGPMLAIGYWCEEGCRGRIELREHKATCSPACATRNPRDATTSPVLLRGDTQSHIKLTDDLGAWRPASAQYTALR
jgi:hypothetical protein